MVKGIQQPSGIGDEGSLIAAAQAARHAGFEAFEPILTESGLLSIGAEEADLRRAGEAIRTTGLTIRSFVRKSPFIFMIRACLGTYSVLSSGLLQLT